MGIVARKFFLLVWNIMRLREFCLMEVASFTAGAAEQFALNPLFRFFFEAAADWCDFLIIYRERFFVMSTRATSGAHI